MYKEIKSRILLVATFPPPVHGSSMVSMQIRDSEIINEAFEVDYVNLGTSRTMAEIGRRSYVLYARKLFRFLGSYFRMLWKLLTHRYDLTYLAITCHDVGFLKDCPFVITARLLSKKYVIHQHNRGMSPYVHRAPYKWLLPLAYSKAKVILLSWRLYDDISEVVKREQVLICPNGLPMPGYLVNSMGNVSENNAHIPEILFLSNLVESKGVWLLLDALQMLKMKGVIFHCSFVGGTSRFISAEKFEAEVEARNLKDMVEYLGPQYGDDKWRAFQRADVFVLPSMDDCLPLTVTEAMMCHLPVVGSDIGAIPDLVEDDVTGFIISSEDLIIESGGEFLDWEPSAELSARIEGAKRLKEMGGNVKKGSRALADRLERLLTNPELRRQMGEAGYERYKKYFTQEAFEKTMLECLKNSLN